MGDTEFLTYLVVGVGGDGAVWMMYGGYLSYWVVVVTYSYVSIVGMTDALAVAAFLDAFGILFLREFRCLPYCACCASEECCCYRRTNLC